MVYINNFIYFEFPFFVNAFTCLHENKGSISDIVIGPHGSGLSNIMVMKEKSSVIELQVVPTNHCYLFPAFNLGLNYYAHYEPGANYYGKWSVDIQKIFEIPILTKLFK